MTAWPTDKNVSRNTNLHLIWRHFDRPPSAVDYLGGGGGGGGGVGRTSVPKLSRRQPATTEVKVSNPAPSM